MTTYQTLPQTVFADQFLGQSVPDSTFDSLPLREDPSRGQNAVLVVTAAGGQPAFPGDWVVRDGKGSYSVLSDADFQAQYQPEPVENLETAPVSPVQPIISPETLAAAIARAETAEAALATLRAQTAAAEAAFALAVPAAPAVPATSAASVAPTSAPDAPASEGVFA